MNPGPSSKSRSRTEPERSGDPLQVTGRRENIRAVRSLGLFDCTMAVAGAMVGSGIFIVSAEISRLTGSPGGLITAWMVIRILTLVAALSYAELASMMPRTGSMYVHLREAFSPLVEFLYGWALFTVIQAGTIAAVALAFARFAGALWPRVSETNYLVRSLHLSSSYALSLSTAQLLAILVIATLTWANARGLEYGKNIQNIFTAAKTGALPGLIILGFSIGRNRSAISANFADFWTPRGTSRVAP